MSKLTVTHLAQLLHDAADILRNRVEASAYADIISGMLLLKRASDQPGILRVPGQSRWEHIHASKNIAPGQTLDEALSQLRESNPAMLGGVLEGLDLSRRLDPGELEDLIDYFDRIPLADADLEFSTVVGRAYDRVLGWFADHAGKKGGEAYTPRSVTRLMVRLIRPQAGQSVYDPFVGSAGMLSQAMEYVEDHDGKSEELAVFGQEKNVSTWSIARLNLLLHGVREQPVLCGDTLTHPLHMVIGGQRRLFDRVLSNPPFSMSYIKSQVTYPERMQYGWAPEQGKADLMNVQHVLAMLRPDGVGAVVTPQGMLFRGGAEAEIRQGIIEDGRIEAVIGIGANVFHGTAIPACILVLRGDSGPPPERRGSVLFINAEREVVTGRTQNRLEPPQVEKIVEVFRDWSQIPRFSRAVSLAELAENGFNLNIGRYVDTRPPDEPTLDIRSALFGGVPRRDIEAQESRFEVFGIHLPALFHAENSDRLEFLPEGCEATAERITELAAPREHELIERCQGWWETAGTEIAQLAGTTRLLKARARLMTSFKEALVPAGILDRYQLAGAFAAWWSDREYDLRSLDGHGFPAVIGGWPAIRGEQSPPESLAQKRVLGILGDDLRSRVEKLAAAERQALAHTFRSWGDRYATSLADLEEQRAAGAARLNFRLAELGYE